MKIALLVSYDGTGFHGFARQRSARTIQGDLEGHLSTLLRAPVATTGAGRTDAGVHAEGQVLSFEVPDGTDPATIARRLNRWLRPEVAVRAAVTVPDPFDARFSARRRTYEYRIYRSEVPDPFRDRFALQVAHPLSVKTMRTAARALVGEHDFASFCRRGQATTVRRVRSIAVRTSGDTLTVRVVADSFCHQMVRSIVGLLLEIGRGRRPPGAAAAALGARDRAAAPVAPARGLHLVAVTYRPNPFHASSIGSG